MGILILPAGRAEAVPECARLAPARGPSGLPVAISLETRCARFELRPDGVVRASGPGIVSSPKARPTVSFGDGISWFLARGRLTASRGPQVLWRSTRRYRTVLKLEGAAVAANAVAFTYRSRLFVAAGLGAAERPAARNERPLGWGRDGLLFTSRGGRDVRLRAADGTFLAVVQARSRTVRFESSTQSVLTVSSDGRVGRFDGRSTVSLARLRELGLPMWSWAEPLAGGLVGITAGSRVAILRADGSVFASARFPRGRRWNAAGNSGLVADPAGRAVALTLTEGNTGYASRGAEWVLVLREGDRVARVLRRERLWFAVCERWTTLAWRDGWLLYASTEGRTLALDTAGRRVVDLSALVARLPGGRADGQHKVELQARWGAAPTA